MANFYKNSQEYEKAINFYTIIIDNIDANSPEIKSDILYRRGGSYERMGKYEKADKDLLHALIINPGDAYVLNYLLFHGLREIIKFMKQLKC